MQREPWWSNAKEAPAPMRREPWLSQSEGGPLAHAPGDSVIPKPRRSPRPCGGGLDGPKAKEASLPMHRGLGDAKAKEAPSPPHPRGLGPRWSQSEGGPLAHTAGALVIPKRSRSPRSCGGGLGVP